MGQRQLQDEKEIISILGFGVTYIRDLMILIMISWLSTLLAIYMGKPQIASRFPA